MLKATLIRIKDDGKCTLGILKIGGITLATLEEPWRNNQRGVSCIPVGTYRVVPHGWEPGSKVRFKRAYRLLGTEPRTAILIHTGNTTDDIEGCILVGSKYGLLNGKTAVLGSLSAMTQLRNLLGPKEFELTIRFHNTEGPPMPKSTLWQRVVQMFTNRKA